MRRCTACWSDLEAGSQVCPQCGARTAEPRTGRRGTVWFAATLAAGIALGVAVTVLLQRPKVGRGDGALGTPHDERAPQAGAGPRKAAASRRSDPAPEAERRHFHVVLQTAEEEPRSVVGLLLRAEANGTPARQLVFLPLRDLPLRGRLSGPAGQPVDLGVVQADERNGFVLLSAADASWLPAPREALVPSAVTPARDLAAIGPDGLGAGQVDVQGRDPTGLLLLLSRELVPGTVILAAEGAALAFCLGAREALPFDQTLLWLGQPATKSLAEVQKLLRSRDPEQLLLEASALLEKGATDQSGAATREALRLLDLALGLARDRKLLAGIDEHRRFGWQQLTRVLARGDAASLQQAIEAAARGLQLLPDHWPLMADLGLLQIEHGDPRQALSLVAQLLRAAPEEVAKISERFCRDLAHLARERIRERRIQDALELLDAGVQLFPTRADLQMARAEALAAAGRADEAAAAAAAAAALDPAFAQEAESLRLVAQRARTPGVVQIPFDPQTNVVHAQVTVSGQPLQLVVDTGASLTTIPSAVADVLQLRKPGNQRVKINTASGVVEGEVVMLPVLQIGSLEVKNVQAVVLDLPDTLQGKGLLGLNVLQRLDMEIDSQNGMLVLKQSRGRRGR